MTIINKKPTSFLFIFSNVTYLNLVRRLKIVIFPSSSIFLLLLLNQLKNAWGCVVFCTTFKLTTKNTTLGFQTFLHTCCKIVIFFLLQYVTNIIVEVATAVAVYNLCKTSICTISDGPHQILYCLKCVCLCITYQIHTDDPLLGCWAPPAESSAVGAPRYC